ncbi:hypothetical protein Nepgr_019334 [Nepenthes gracilis]|uniref:Uncharacterized protein n=1 Tax=Nepenthes gracilis TaxID=150966 RepID=A0AAD3ST81_NEPGR|nr:hypothetical protein Nepgr_019334 [Nepenthes gracilis]
MLSLAKPFVEEALRDYFGGTHIPDKMVIADLGCSSGPNALTPASEIIDAVHAQCQKLGHRSPEFMVFLNDLPGNDFNDIFTSLQPDFFSKLREDEQCRVAGVPGSFYGRLFLSRSLHFVHSSSSLHWLSQVPPGLDAKNGPMQNKGNIYITKTSTKAVIDAYKQQFKTDFNSFLKSRAEEVIPGGRMVLTFLGRMSNDPTTKEGFNHHIEMIAQSLMNMVSKAEEEMREKGNKMDMARVLHVNGGTKEITYAKNSSAQKQILFIAKPLLEEALHEYFGGTQFQNKMVIAELGCSSGPNALTPALEIIDVVHAQCQKRGRRLPEFMVFLNDLPGNDFNDIFTSLQQDFFSKLREEEQCRVAGVPGSFYGRLFLSRSLHFVHSSSSLHWLSQVPPGLDAKSGAMQNKGKVYISKTSTKA